MGVRASMAECVMINNECLKNRSLKLLYFPFLPPSTHIAANSTGCSAVSIMNIAAFRSVLAPPLHSAAPNHHHLVMTQPFDP